VSSEREQEPGHPARSDQPDPAAATRALREQALTVDAAALGLAPTPRLPHVWGALMETGFAEGVVTLVTFADGTTSLYFSNGGGMIGLGQRDDVRAAAEAFLAEAEAHRAHAAPAAATPQPGPGRVRFYLRTFGGTLTAEADEEDLGYHRHPLSPVFHAAQSLLTAIREASGQ